MPFWYGIGFSLRRRKQHKKKSGPCLWGSAFNSCMDMADKMRKKEDDDQK